MDFLAVICWYWATTFHGNKSVLVFVGYFFSLAGILSFNKSLGIRWIVERISCLLIFSACKKISTEAAECANFCIHSLARKSAVYCFFLIF